MSAQHVTLRQRIRAWFHPSEDALRRAMRLGKRIGIAEGIEQAKKQIPAQWRPKVAQAANPQPAPQQIFPAPVLAPLQPGDRLKEYLQAHPRPASGPAHLTPEQRADIFAQMGTAPEKPRVHKADLDEWKARHNPLSRPLVEDVMQAPADESWLVAPMPEKLPPVHVDIWEEFDELASKSGLLPTLDDDPDGETLHGLEVKAIVQLRMATKAVERRMRYNLPELEEGA